MIDGYETKEMKPTTEATKAPAPKQVEDGTVYELKGLWNFKIKGQLYQYRTKAQAEAGLLIVNG